MNAKRWIALGIAIGVFLFSIIINTASALIFGNFSKNMKEVATGDLFAKEVVEEGNPLKQIAILEVNGVILDSGDSPSLFSDSYSHKEFIERLNKVKKDPSVKALIIRINSPGGGINESGEIHKKIVEIQEETKKPIYVSMGTTAASGGYYIAAPADKIFAYPGTVTGSLGVIMQSTNFGKLAENFGIEHTTIKSGKYKDIGSSLREMTDQEKDILQSMVDHAYEEFLGVIVEGRELPEDKVRQLADGRIYDGHQAKELQLIDELGYIEDVIVSMKKDHQLEDAEVVKYSSSPGLGSLFKTTAQKLSSGSNIDHALKSLINPEAPRLFYLYTQ